MPISGFEPEPSTLKGWYHAIRPYWFTICYIYIKFKFADYVIRWYVIILWFSINNYKIYLSNLT